MTPRTLPPARRLGGAATLALLLLAPPVAAEGERTTEQKIKAALDAIKGVKSSVADGFERGVTETVFRLVVGNLAGDPKLKLPSETRAYLDDGLVQLEKLLTDNDMQAKLAANAKLVARVDVALRLRPQLEKKRDLARKEERDRLNQLRDLAATYRDLTASLAAMNTYFVLGDHAGARKLHGEVESRLKKIEEVANRRVDYYLFKDEPKLDAAEVKLLTAVAEPLARDLASHFRSLQGLMAFRLATDARTAMTAAQRRKGLEEALAEVEGVVADAGKAGLLAHYVDGVSRQELGLLATAENPLDAAAHRDAAAHFKAARASLDRANARLADEAKTAAHLRADLERRRAELASSKVFLDAADAAVLARGLLMHRDGKLIVALARARLRSGDAASALDLLQRAVRAGALEDDDRDGMLVRGRAVLTLAWDRLARGREKVPADERRALLEQLRDARGLLAKAGTDSAAAYIALSYAYASYLDPDADTAEAKEAFGKLKDLVAALKEQPGAGEALVAARLAQGFLAIRFQPAYRDDALLAFAAAADEQARLPGGQASKLFGSPVLAAMLSRPDMKGLKVAAEERQLRELVGRVAEGLAAMKLGAADAAAKQMKATLAQVEALSGDAPVDAGKLLDQREADARAALRTRARALAVLTLVAGNQPDVAALEALKLSTAKLNVATADELTDAKVRQAAAGIDDPLASYALALAVEEHAATKLKPGSASARALLAEAARLQTGIKGQLAKSPPLRERYPQVELLTAQAIERLTRPGSYVARARQLRVGAQATDAVRVIEEGLRRHPGERDLQQERILAKLDEAELSGSHDRELLRKVVAEAAKASKDGVLKDARGLIALGEAHERLGEYDDAIAAYRKALEAKPTEGDALRARVRISVLEARLDKGGAPAKK
jgi:hypothetical protein